VATVDTDGDFLIGTVGFLLRTGGGVVFFSSRLSRLLRMSEGVLLASVMMSDFRGGFSAVIPSRDLVSSDRLCAATFPNSPPPLRSVFMRFVESFRESFEPKLSLRYEFVVGFGDLMVVLVLLVVMMVFVPIGGRSGRSFVGVAKKIEIFQNFSLNFPEFHSHSDGNNVTKLSGKTPILPRSSPFHQPLSGSSLLRIVTISPSVSFNSSSFSGA
jgi:hypothetical protein